MISPESSATVRSPRSRAPARHGARSRAPSAARSPRTSHPFLWLRDSVGRPTGCPARPGGHRRAPRGFRAACSGWSSRSAARIRVEVTCPGTGRRGRAAARTAAACPVSARSSSRLSASRPKGSASAVPCSSIYSPLAGLDDVHVHVGARVLRVGEVEHRFAFDDADAGRRHVVGDRHRSQDVLLAHLVAGREPARRTRRRWRRSGCRRPPG